MGARVPTVLSKIMNPVYIFNLKVRHKRGARTTAESTIKGDVAIKDAVDGDEADKQDLVKVARYMLSKMAEDHPDIMTADSMTYTVRRAKPNKAKTAIR